VQVDGGHILVHALEPGSIHDLFGGEMDRRADWVEGSLDTAAKARPSTEGG
jgi:hypothetical protein